MKFLRLILVMSLLVAFSSPAFASYSISNIIDEFGTATTTFTSANAYTLSANDRVEIVIVWYGDATNEPTSVSDTNGNTWAAIPGASVINFNTDGLSYAAWECKNVTTAGSTHITVDFAATTSHAGIAGVDVSGLSNTAAAQSVQQGQVNPGTATNAVTSGTVTPASQPAMLFGLAQNISGSYSTGMSAGTGFTSHALANFSGVNGAGAAIAEDERLTSTSPVAATATFTQGATTNTVAFGIVVPEGGAAPSSKVVLSNGKVLISNGKVVN